MDGVIAQYRSLTGKATILPRWAYGYIQSQERYETRKEILDTVKEYRERNIGLDGIVLDWCSWKGNLWGQKTFDETRFPDPDDMMEQLHEAQVHFMLSRQRIIKNLRKDSFFCRDAAFITPYPQKEDSCIGSR